MFRLNRLLSSKALKSLLEVEEEIAVNSRKFTCGYGGATPLVKTTKKLLVLQSHQIGLDFTAVKFFHLSMKVADKDKDEVDQFDTRKSLLYTSEFEKWEEKNKKTFLETVRVYKRHVKNRAGHVDFIKAALKNMKHYGVHRDLDCYKKIVDVLPKGIYVTRNRWQALAMYFPRQQYVIMDLLDKMGENGVWPDAELGMMIINIFGKNSEVNRKFERKLYWSLKWRNRSPFILPQIVPSDPLLLAKLAIKRITSVDPQTEINVLEDVPEEDIWESPTASVEIQEAEEDMDIQTLPASSQKCWKFWDMTSTLKDSTDKTWIVSGQSPKQKKLLQKHSPKVPVIVEGGNLVWLRDKCINYFVLKADCEPFPFVCPEDTSDISNLQSRFLNTNLTERKKVEPTVHEQDDGIIFAVCATGTSSKDSLLSWIRILEKMENSVLADIPVLFRFHEKEKLPATISKDLVQQSGF